MAKLKADQLGLSLSAYINQLVRRDLNLPNAFGLKLLPYERVESVAEEQSPYETERGRVETDHDRCVTSVNDAFSRFCGHARSELLGKRLAKILQGPLTEPAAIATLRAALDARREVSLEITNHHADGHPYRVRLTIKPTPTGFVGETELLPSS